jgi:hypothetical protein
MRTDSHNRKSAAVKLHQPGNRPYDKAHWLVLVESWFARVEQSLEPADRVDYLVRQAIFGRVKWVVSAGPRSALLGAEFDECCASASGS